MTADTPCQGLSPNKPFTNRKGNQANAVSIQGSTSCTTVDGQKTFCSTLRLLEPSSLWILIRRIFRPRARAFCKMCFFVKRVRNFKLRLYFLDRHKSHMRHKAPSPEFDQFGRRLTFTWESCLQRQSQLTTVYLNHNKHVECERASRGRVDNISIREEKK